MNNKFNTGDLVTILIHPMEEQSRSDFLNKIKDKNLFITQIKIIDDKKVYYCTDDEGNIISISGGILNTDARLPFFFYESDFAEPKENSYIESTPIIDTCEACGSTNDIEYIEDPYQKDINNTSSFVFLCESCYQSKQGDI